MEYESVILKRLIKTYGVVGNPRYISEIIKEFIVQGKERFPNLFTYQSDWLVHIDEFGLNPSYTVSYTGQSIYAPNTLERPVKSAILSGQTLVNIPTTTSYYVTNKNNSGWVATFEDSVHFVKPNTKYYIGIFNNSSESKNYGLREDPFTIETKITISPNGYGIMIGTTVENITSKALITNKSEHSSDNDVKILFIEYQQGMEDWDIPYFEGMQSVKMPVLMTTGKNLLNPSWKKEYGKFYPFKLKKGTTLTLSTKDSTPSLGGNLLFTTVSGGEKWFSIDEGATENTITLYEDVYQVNNVLTGDIEYQLEIGSVATSYEPYKSNILSTSEDIELRGIGDVQDEMNLVTGELTQRFHKTTIDENYSWTLDGENNGYLHFGTALTVKGNVEGELKGASNGLPYGTLSGEGSQEQVLVFEHKGWITQLRIMINPSRLETPDVKGFIKYITNNPLELIYAQQPTVKTVDLTILDQNGQNVKQLMSFNGGTHFNTRSLEGSPLPSVTVTVETDLEETLKVCSLEGNTM